MHARKPAPFAPVAIVGRACRLPGGVDDPETLLQFLLHHGDGVRDTPEDRWSVSRHFDAREDAPGRMFTRRAAFLERSPWEIEPAAFGLSPREAAALDPQQRLLLETAYEALEDAGIPLERAAGSRTGVYVGGFTIDHQLLATQPESFPFMDGHTSVGMTMTVLSNRLSHAFDLRGPSLTVDTACSSSLVAVHLAAQALAAGECDAALVGGVNAMVFPAYSVVMCKGRFLAPDGRSKAFDAAADGYGRGEGAVLFVLRRLEDAVRDQDRIHAVLLGTGVNQDGRTDGMPVPRPEAQAALVRATCAAAGVDPSLVGYVQAHGTGTRAGDPVECDVIGGFYGAARPAPLPIGSVKTNIGHLEAAAGAAGLLVASLAVETGTIPPIRALVEENPQLKLQERNLYVPTEPVRWDDERRVAAVNAFGYGGTNAHALIGPAPTGRSIPASIPGPRLFLVSGHDAGARARRAEALARWVDRTSPDLRDLGFTLARRRSQQGARLAVVADGAGPLAEALAAAAARDPHPRLVAGEAPTEPATVVGVLTGMGPQFPRMGAELFATEPAFRQAAEEVDRAFVARTGRSVWAEIATPPESSRMHQNLWAQQANLLLQIALARWLEHRGLRFSAWLGHSVGEVSAAYLAGAIDLEQAVSLSAVRAELQQTLAGQGGMLAVGAPAEQVQPVLPEGVVIAAYNAPDSVTIAGPLGPLAVAEEVSAARAWFVKKVRVEVPYHSPAMEPLKPQFLERLSGLAPRAPAKPLYSTMSGKRVSGSVHGAEYWWQNARRPVRLEAAVRAALADGHRVFVELGPHPVLSPALSATFEAAGVPSARAVSTLRRGAPERESALLGVGAAHCAGASLDLDALAEEGRQLDLPRFPWARDVLRSGSQGLVRRLTERTRPLIGPPSTRPGVLAEVELLGPELSFLEDHRVDDREVFPAAGYVELLLEAVALARGREHDLVLDDLTIERALLVDRAAPTRLAVTDGPDGALEVRAQIGEGEWARHAGARCWAEATPPPPPSWSPFVGSSRSVEALYRAFSSRGLSYGPAFRPILGLLAGPSRASVTLEVPKSNFLVHPALLDGALQALLAAAAGIDDPSAPAFLPIRVRRVAFAKPISERATAEVIVTESDRDHLVGDILVRDEGGAPALWLLGLECRAFRAQPGARRAAAWVHGPAFVEAEGPNGPAELLIDARDVGEAELGSRLARLKDRLLEAARRPAPPRTRILTSGSMLVSPGDLVEPAQAAVLGFARVARAELPSLALQIVDADGASPDDLPLDEEEVAVRSGRIYAGRIRAGSSGVRPAAAVGNEEPIALKVGSPGRLDTLKWVRGHREPPGPGQIEVEVLRVGLNFKDVLKAMGLLGDAALEGTYLGRDLGMEAAGRVRRVGPGVERFSPGDEVFVYRGGALRRYLTVPERFAVKKLPGHRLEDAAGYFVFFTAAYALLEAGRLQRGERVLVHSAAGGVGLAAVQVAKSVGAEIHATAGTQKKRAYLRELGVASVHDSRRLGFADAVLAATGGEGVDVVLNALAGPFLQESLRALGPAGRFVELGKQDIAAGRGLPLGPFHRGLSFSAVDLDRLASDRPRYFGPLVESVLDRFSSGALTPLPTEVLPAAEVEAGFRRLGSGELIGKLVIDLEAGAVERTAPPLVVAPEGQTVLVTGGTGGLGAAVAEALMRAGARHVSLWSRTGRVEEALSARWEALRAAGIAIDVRAVDIGEKKAVEAALAQMEGSLPPVGALYHFAGITHDAPLDRLDRDAIEAVLAVKLAGARHLLHGLEGRPLSAIVFASSVSGWVGNPGQAGYAAANAALDGLAARLQREGRPAVSVAFGAVGGVGMLARDRSTAAHLAGLGLRPMPAEELAFALLDRLPSSGPELGLIDLDWDAFARAVKAPSWSRLSELRSGTEVRGLGSIPPEERAAHAQEALRIAAAEVFRMSPDALSLDRPLRDLGVDSLLAVELRARFEEAGVQLSTMDILAGRSLAELAAAAARDAAPLADPGTGFLDRICVSPPYFDLFDVSVVGDQVVAKVHPVGVGDGRLQRGPLGAAEAARHLAILGSCAVSLRNPAPGKTYYPVRTAVLGPEGLASVGAPGEIHLSARCSHFDGRAGEAAAETEARDGHGQLLCRFEVGYHVIPADAFVRMFEEKRQATTQGPDRPYDVHVPLPHQRGEGRSMVARIEQLRAETCAGHFDGFPAFPVSVMARHALDLIGAVAGLDHPGQRFRISSGRCETFRFIWAGAEVCFVASAEGSGYRCEVETGGQEAARFSVELEPV